jgi:broad specificity phosphatase PhoE
MKLYLVRHGETKGNAGAKHQGPQEELSEIGLEQATILGERFKSIPVDLLIASPYVRTQQTARKIAEVKHIPITNNDLIVEFKWPTVFAGKERGDPEIKELRRKIEENWELNPTWKHSDEDSFAEIKKRACDFLDYAKTLPHEHIAVVTHARFLKVLMAVLLHGPLVSGKIALDLIYSLSHNNTGITVAEYTNHWNVITANDHAHLGDYHRQRDLPKNPSQNSF